MKLYRCKGRKCKNQLTEQELKNSEMYYHAYYGLCADCSQKLNDEVDKAVGNLERRLRSNRNLSEADIQGEINNFRHNVLSGNL